MVVCPFPDARSRGRQIRKGRVGAVTERILEHIARRHLNSLCDKLENGRQAKSFRDLMVRQIDFLQQCSEPGFPTQGIEDSVVA